MSPKKFDKITVDYPDFDSISDFSKTVRENTGLFGVPTVFEISVFASFLWLICQMNACHGKSRRRQREKERKEKVL